MPNPKNKKVGENICEQQNALTNVVELLHRYFTGAASAREKEAVETWTPIKDEEALLKDEGLAKECDTASVWNAVSHTLASRPKPQPFLKKNIRHIAAAAVIFLLLGSTLFYYVQQKPAPLLTGGAFSEPRVSYTTSDTQTRQIVLPDGSRIFLNRGTELHYARGKFNRHQRDIWLEGEAFFEVAKNPEKPFIIHTGEMTTTVCGTSFNVKSYKELDENTVSVREGKVEIRNQAKLLGTLTANQQLIYNCTKKEYGLETLDWKDAAGWMDGDLIFNCAGAPELKLKLKQHFNLDLQVQGNVLEGIRLRSIFTKDVTAGDVMRSICGLYGLKYTQRKNEIILYK